MHKGIFLQFQFCEKLVELLEAKFTKVWGGLDDGVPWSFSLRLVHGELPAIHHV